MRMRTLDSKRLTILVLAAGMGISGATLAIERAQAQSDSSAPHAPATSTTPAGPLPGETAPTPPATVNPSTPYTVPPPGEQPVSEHARHFTGIALINRTRRFREADRRQAR